MFSETKFERLPEPENAGLDDEDTSNSQEAVPVPFIAGERKISLKWISPIYNQRAVTVPLARSGKK